MFYPANQRGGFGFPESNKGLDRGNDVGLNSGSTQEGLETAIPDRQTPPRRVQAHLQVTLIA